MKPWTCMSNTLTFVTPAGSTLRSRMNARVMAAFVMIAPCRWMYCRKSAIGRSSGEASIPSTPEGDLDPDNECQDDRRPESNQRRCRRTAGPWGLCPMRRADAFHRRGGGLRDKIADE